MKLVRCTTSRHFANKAREEWPGIRHADVAWSHSELIRICSVFGNVPQFGTSLTLQNWSDLRFLGIVFRKNARKGLKFDMLMYPDTLLDGWNFGHGLLIFFILAIFWLSETSQICSFRAFISECMWGIGYNLPCWCILATFRTDSNLVKAYCNYSSFSCLFWVSVPIW